MTATDVDVCALAHRLLRDRELHRFPFDSRRKPKNGLYVLFEAGEEGHDGARIVQVGTHTGQAQLPTRLGQHFLLENKDRSILRKHVGRCILAKAGDPYLEIWNKDLTTREARLALPPAFDVNHQSEIESQVSRYIRDRFSFVVLPVAEKTDRLRLKAGLASLVSRCPVCRPSADWLGLYSPKDRIRESGLWQVNELYKTPPGESELYDWINEVLATQSAD